MNPSSKLLIAAALVAGGYGLATLLGTPDLPYVSGSSRSTEASLFPGTDPQAVWVGGASVVGSVRLLPESNAGTADAAHNRATLAPPPALAEDVGQVTPASDNVGSVRTTNALPWRTPAPRATLGDVRSAGPSVSDTTITAAPGGGQLAQTSATQVASASVEPVGEMQPAAHQASFDWPPTAKAPAPTLVPVDAPADGPAAVQIHVVVDGDSLARLAGRYLDDPHRGDEIYRLNRDVLPSPDLLPIGAELKIPVGRQPGDVQQELSDSRVGAASTDRQHGLVPVSPAPATTVAAPRAHLLRPLPAR